MRIPVSARKKPINGKTGTSLIKGLRKVTWSFYSTRDLNYSRKAEILIVKTI